MVDDLIRRSDVKDKLKECIKKASPPLMYPDWNDAVLAVMTAPAVDAVEVVRCRECKHWSIPDDSYGWCAEWENTVENPECYCACGQRREDGDGDG